MGGIDTIVCWPKNCDYPLWRQFIHDERNRFSRVIAVFTEHDGGDYSGWLRKNCPEVEFIDSPPVNGDWRDTAVNHALDLSKASRVWFTEQDFFVTDPGFWDARGEVVGFDAGDSRPLHPASIFADRSLIDKTSRYFGPKPIDHFWRFGRELCWLAKPTMLTDGFAHLQGVSQNHSLIDRNEDAGVFRRGQFREYLAKSLLAAVPLEETWAANARREVYRVLPEEP